MGGPWSTPPGTTTGHGVTRRDMLAAAMIVAAETTRELPSGALRCVTQNDHAHFAAELLSLWRRDGLPDHPRRKALLFAAREHDNGWRETDAAPRCSPDGRPHDFLSLPEPERRELWNRGVVRYRGQEPYGALLIVRHALTLHRDRDDDPAWHGVLDTWRGLEEELLEASGAEPSAVDGDYRFLDLADLASLLVCCPWRDPFERHGHRLELVSPPDPASPDELPTLGIDPFPLAGATTFDIPCRRIPARTYGGDGDLAMELATARWGRLRVRVGPGETL